MNVVAIFDIGKTNKKIFLFNEMYQIVWEKSIILPETIDEDGFPCESILELKNWIFIHLAEIRLLKEFRLKAINFSTYGASFVHVDDDGHALTPLYNYLKPYPEYLKKIFYDKYGGEKKFALLTASPVLGNLNSGMQIFCIKEKNPELFNKIKYCLHLPQYLSSLLTKCYFTDITSVGCHTNLWDYTEKNYHQWVTDEHISRKIPPLHSAEDTIDIDEGISVGIGLHDSSSAIIPYIMNFTEPFILLSTGTWIITMNPFNDQPLTFEELENDCLCYLQYKGSPVKAARIFAGKEHDVASQKIARHFKVAYDAYTEVVFDKSIISKLRYSTHKENLFEEEQMLVFRESAFNKRNLMSYDDFETAYHQLILDLVSQLITSIQLVIHNSPVKKVFVDGGFSKNSIFMNLVAEAFPEMEVYAASMAQASALGAALVIHKNWNSNPIPNDLIDLKFYKH